MVAKNHQCDFIGVSGVHVLHAKACRRWSVVVNIIVGATANTNKTVRHLYHVWYLKSQSKENYEMPMAILPQVQLIQ